MEQVMAGRCRYCNKFTFGRFKWHYINFACCPADKDRAWADLIMVLGL